MRKRKPKAVRRIRRSPYERSLEHATQRLKKALSEQMDCQVKLEALNREIPYLQGVIRALTPVDQQRQFKAGDTLVDTTRREFKLESAGDQSAFLSRFVKPIPLTQPQARVPPDGIVVDQSEPFIPDIIPGEELLP